MADRVRVEDAIRRGAASLPRDDVPHKPVRIRVDEQRHAIALAQELAGLPGLDLRRTAGCWEVAVEAARNPRLLVLVLGAVRDVLAGQPSASALVLLDGRQYRMQGE